MGFIGVVKAILALLIGAGIAYFWTTLRPDDAQEIIFGIGLVGALASFSVLHFMGKGQG